MTLQQRHVTLCLFALLCGSVWSGCQSDYPPYAKATLEQRANLEFQWDEDYENSPQYHEDDTRSVQAVDKLKKQLHEFNVESAKERTNFYRNEIP